MLNPALLKLMIDMQNEDFESKENKEENHTTHIQFDSEKRFFTSKKLVQVTIPINNK